MVKFVDTKTKQRHCYSVAIAKVIDMDGYYISIMDIDTKKSITWTFINKLDEDEMEPLEIAIGKSILKLMRFKA